MEKDKKLPDTQSSARTLAKVNGIQTISSQNSSGRVLHSGPRAAVSQATKAVYKSRVSKFADKGKTDKTLKSKDLIQDDQGDTLTVKKATVQQHWNQISSQKASSSM